jgi:RNA polymerase sigma-70 factor (ECF subfamily)
MTPNESITEAKSRFLRECEAIRPELHRFTSRMLGSVTEGEDVVQDTLAVAFFRLGELEAAASLRAWMFRIAYRKCLDLQRARRRLQSLEESDDVDLGSADAADDPETKELAHRALTGIVLRLPVRERACVVLKDVLDHSLEEVAEMTGSTVGAVKAALHRGRAKLRDVEDALPTASPERGALVALYLDRFNRRDWDGVRALLADDARLELVGRFEGPLRDQYFGNYGALAWPWKLALATVDGRDQIVHFRLVDGAWRAHTVILLDVEGDRVRVVRDYVHVPYLLAEATVPPPEAPATA